VQARYALSVLRHLQTQSQDEHGKAREMLKTIALSVALIAAGSQFCAAQDIAGIEDCTRTAGLDKRTGCLQSNINFLQRLVTRNSLDARERLNAAHAEITALRSAVASLQASLERLKSEQKSAGETKPPKK
jgi:hypothetical protein